MTFPVFCCVQSTQSHRSQGWWRAAVETGLGRSCPVWLYGFLWTCWFFWIVWWGYPVEMVWSVSPGWWPHAASQMAPYRAKLWDQVKLKRDMDDETLQNCWSIVWALINLQHCARGNECKQFPLDEKGSRWCFFASLCRVGESCRVPVHGTTTPLILSSLSNFMYVWNESTIWEGLSRFREPENGRMRCHLYLSCTYASTVAG